MAATKRSSIQVQKDRLRIAEFLLSGRTEREIGAELHMTQQMVAYDKKVIEKEWKASRETDMELLIAREIRHIGYLYREAIRGWERSFGVKALTEIKKSTTTQADQKESASKSSEELTGDVRFLTAARELRKDYRDLLGLDAPKELRIPVGKRLIIEDEG